MAAFLDGCRFNPAAGGTADWTYSSVVPGYQNPSAAGVINGRLYKYRAESADLSQWEFGEGTYNTGTGVLARTTVLYNSSGTTSKINFSTVPQVAIVALKEDLISVEEANSFSSTQQAQARSNIGVTAVGAAAVGHIPGESGSGTASAGEIGEEGHAALTVSYTASATAQNVTSISVPAGDFEISGFVIHAGAGATASSDWNSVISITAAPATSAGASIIGIVMHNRMPAGQDYSVLQTHPSVRVSNASPTTYYLHASATFSGAIYSVTGYLKYRRTR
jgi:hypothetical protein